MSRNLTGGIINDLLSNGFADELVGGIINTRRKRSEINAKTALNDGSHLAVA
jgi:hypothetical protein